MFWSGSWIALENSLILLTGKMRNVCVVSFVDIPEERKPLWRPGCIWEDHFEVGENKNQTQGP
jgi:hypothetical protein